MLEKYWIKCPICNGKTRVQVFYNTVLRNFPLFCPKCKLTHIVDVEKLEIIIKNSEKQDRVPNVGVSVVSPNARRTAIA